MSQYIFHTTCVSSDSDSIHELQNLADIGHGKSQPSFNQLKQMLGDDFWNTYADTASQYKGDPYIYAHQSTYQGAPCVFIQASHIEHIYLLNSEDIINSNGYSYSYPGFCELNESELMKRLDVIEQITDKAEPLYESLIALAEYMTPAIYKSIKGDRYANGFSKLIQSRPELINKVLHSYAVATAGHNNEIKQLRITPAALLSECRSLRYELLDRACCVLDLACSKGHEFGLRFPYIISEPTAVVISPPKVDPESHPAATPKQAR